MLAGMERSSCSLLVPWTVLFGATRVAPMALVLIARPDPLAPIARLERVEFAGRTEMSGMIRILVTVAVLGSVGNFAGLAMAQDKQGEAFSSDISSLLAKLEAQCAHRRRTAPPDPRDDCLSKLQKLRSEAQIGYGQVDVLAAGAGPGNGGSQGNGIGPGSGGGQGNGIGPGSGGGQGRGRR
jgi:hypothetical protein